jgi:hypothetical protein
LPHKREGPASQGTTPRPREAERTDTPFLPLPEFSRKSAPAARGLPTKTPPIPRRRGQDRSWRGFSLRLYAEPGVDGIKAFRGLLKVALRRFGLRAIDAREIREPPRAGDSDGPPRS